MNCYTEFVIFWLPNLSSSLPHVSAGLVKVHDFSAFQEVISDLINEVDPVYMEVLIIELMVHCLFECSVRNPLSLVEIS